jgi:hypothetical protein
VDPLPPSACVAVAGAAPPYSQPTRDPLVEAPATPKPACGSLRRLSISARPALQERWQRARSDERVNTHDVTVVLVMSYHPDTFACSRLWPDLRQLPHHLIETLRGGEDLSFGVDQ